MYKHIIWDFDGTLFDTYPILAKAVINVLEEQGIYESYDKVMSLMKVSFTHLFNYINDTFYISDTLVSNFKKYKREVEEKNIKPFPHVVDVCRRVYEGKGFNHLYTHRGNSAVEFLKKYDLFQYFKGIITSENNFKRKPEPEALLWLVNEYKIGKSEALMIGDRDIDILAAKNAGIDGCYFKSYPLYDCDFAKYKITDISQLIDLLELQ